MDDASATDDAQPALDVLTSDPRELMRALLPAARTEYVRAWEFLADAATPLERRRIARDRAVAIASDHGIVASALRDRERTLTGDDLLNARHLADELERHVDALTRISTISPIGLLGAKDLRPESLGCGRRYRDPSRTGDAATGAKTRGAGNEPKTTEREREARGKGRRPRQGGGQESGSFSGDRRPRRGDGPVKGVTSGPTKHESQLGDDLDPETRAKLEALRSGLDG